MQVYFCTGLATCGAASTGSANAPGARPGQQAGARGATLLALPPFNAGVDALQPRGTSNGPGTNPLCSGCRAIAPLGKAPQCLSTVECILCKYIIARINAPQRGDRLNYSVLAGAAAILMCLRYAIVLVGVLLVCTAAGTPQRPNATIVHFPMLVADPSTYQVAINLAVEEINANATLLPNHTLVINMVPFSNSDEGVCPLACPLIVASPCPPPIIALGP